MKRLLQFPFTLLMLVTIAGKLPAQERPGNRAFFTVGRSSLGFNCGFCDDVDFEAERVGAWGIGMGIARPLTPRLALRFEGNVAKFPGEYLGTLTAGVEYQPLSTRHVFIDAGLGVYHQTTSNDCLGPAESGATSGSGACGWDQQFAPALTLGFGTTLGDDSGLKPMIRLGWQRSLASGFGSSSFPFNYNQVTLSAGVSVRL